MVIIKEPLKLDIVRIVDNMIMHQQIERRNGLTFMRMKRSNHLTIK